jgi:single-strand DNA-binding protein
MNKIVLVGRLTRDPEVRWSQGNEPLAIARFTLAVNRRARREGDPTADFIPCVVFGKTAEFMEKYYKKGMAAGVSGRLQVRNYTDPQGQNRTFTEVVGDEVEFTESKAVFESRQQSAPPQEGAGGYGSRSSAPVSRAGSSAAKTQAPTYEPEAYADIADGIDDDDLPF